MRGRFDALSHSWVTLVMNRALVGPLNAPAPQLPHLPLSRGAGKGEQGNRSWGTAEGHLQSVPAPRPGFWQAGCPSRLQHKGSKEG